MPMNSINTNVGAMIALQSLNAINAELFTVQRRISTGFKVGSAKDNGAIWAIAQNQRAESRSLNAVKSSLQRGQSIVDVAISGAESVSDLLTQMKEKALAASDTTLDTAARAALSEDYVALRRQIDKVAANAEFSGVSLISAGGAGNVKALANSSATSTIDVDHIDLSTTGAAISGTVADLTGTIGTAELTAIDNAMKAVNAAAGRLGTGAKALDTHLTFVGKQQDTIDAGVGRLVDADLAKESARLQALQVQQQLAIIALGIANRAPSLLLQLFQQR
ncbi:flagellin [Caulobacter mirabilis]|uniref:Flagellin n=1 Tax=Caulobacter mirabilis TaxID=69666 RepID=A0A2D2ATK9_9CAUL|nr:flagellin [Caulobacter mirabilis]ATQ41352.1 flagellin [Caulobacter mirabilis]